MLIRIIEDSMGNVIAYPVNAKIRASIERDAIANGAPDGFEAELFMQQPDVDTVRETLGPRAIWRGEVNDGATIRVDAWDFRHMVGYAAD